MENEIWKDIKGFEGIYQVSSYGKVKRLFTKVKAKNNILRFTPPKILSGIKDSAGYIMVVLSKNNKAEKHLVHRLVAKTFIPNPENKRTVNHKNRIKSDNRIENLEWMTHRENVIHYYMSKNSIK